MEHNIMYKSQSGKFIIEHEKDYITESDTTYTVVNLINTQNGSKIYTYKLRNCYKPFEQFVLLNGVEWWISGRDYMLQLFVNCETGEVYDDPNKVEQSEDYIKGSMFIWRGNAIASPDGKYLFVEGCFWACPYEWRLFDISDLKNGYKEIDLMNDITILDSTDPDPFFDSFSDYTNIKFVDNKKVEIYEDYKKYYGYFILP